MKNLARLLAGIIGIGAGPAACTDNPAPKPEKSWLETYAEKFPKDYAEYYLRFFHAYSCQPANKEAEELYDKVVRSAIRTTTFSSGGGSAEDVTRSGWWDMAYVQVIKTRPFPRSDGYTGDDGISLTGLRLERVYSSYLNDNKIVRLIQNFNPEDISRLNIKTVADLNRFLEHTCRLVSGYDMT